MAKRSITPVRRVVQLLAFLFIIYGGFLWQRPIETPLGKIKASTPRTSQYSRERILWVSGKESITGLYLPSLACRFVARYPLFQSCSLHLLSENLTWRTSFRVLLPHLLWVTVLTFLLARFWCGWICPLGAITDVLDWIRRTCHLEPWQVGRDWSRFFFHLRQFLLWGTLVISLFIALPIFGRTGVNDALFLIYCQLCPARLIYPELGGVNPCWYDATSRLTLCLSVIGWGCLIVFFLGFFVPRLWCRFCGVGALLSYFNRGGMVALEKHPSKCTFCGTCHRVCPVGVERVAEERTNNNVTDASCVLCLRCVQDCPEKECLHAKICGGTIVKS